MAVRIGVGGCARNLKSRERARSPEKHRTSRPCWRFQTGPPLLRGTRAPHTRVPPPAPARNLHAHGAQRTRTFLALAFFPAPPGVPFALPGVPFALTLPGVPLTLTLPGVPFTLTGMVRH